MSTKPMTKLEMAETALKELVEAAYSTLCESNGVSDNEWRTEDGKAIPQWPMDSFYEALQKLDAAYTKAKEYFEPEEAELARKWVNACSTAAFIVDEFEKNPTKRSANSMRRNIADAIYGTLIQTADDRKAGRNPTTMADKLADLVASGKLVEVKPSPDGGR